jgi:hypothetical protein
MKINRQIATDNQAIEWFENKLNKTIVEINDQFENSEFLMLCI